MADSIVRLRIDSQEYDAKLKKAGDALNRYFRNTVDRDKGKPTNGLFLARLTNIVRMELRK